MSYDRLLDSMNTFENIKIVGPQPNLYKFWKNNPLDHNTIIDGRKDGFRPYEQTILVKEPQNDLYTCAIYQTPCSTMLPVNKCYMKDPNEWLSDIFMNR